MENFFPKLQCGSRKVYSTQQCLTTLIEKWKSSSDKGKFLEALLTDLSNALDCLPYELLIAKLHAYGFSLPALRLVHSYLSNRKQGKTFRQSLVTSYQSPVTCYQSLVTRYQSLVTSYLSLVTSYQLLVTSYYNHDHNIMRIVDVLPNFPFTTSETEPDYQ